MEDSNQTKKLKIVQVGESVLREKARELSKDEILSDSIQQLIKEMQVMMREAPGVGLAAPQVGIPIQLLVIEDRVEYHAKLTSQQLLERQRSEVPFHVIINPKLSMESEARADFFEGCLSVPGFRGIVSRALSVRVEGLNEQAEPVFIKAQGWYARILQHEIDHLRGILYLDRLKAGTLVSEENYQKLWANQPIAEVLSQLS